MPLTVPGPRRPLPEPETQPLPADNPFLVTAQRLRQRDDEDEAKRRTVITTAGTDLDPERAARVLRAQARSAQRGFALPATLLAEADTLDVFEKAERAAEFNDRDFIAQAPAFAAWQGQHPANAAVTVDDLPQLANLEATARHTRHLRHRRDGVFELLDPEGRITWAGRDPYQFQARLRNIRTEQERSDELGRGMRSIYGDGAFGQFVTGALGSVGLSARLLGIGSEATHEVLAGIQQAQAEWDSTWSADFQRGAGQLFADVPLMMLGGPMARAAKSLGTVAAARSTVIALAASAASPTAGRVAETLAKVAMAVPAPVAKAAGTVALTGVAVQPLALREGLATWEEHGFGHGLAAWGIETGVSAAFGRTGVERALVPGSRMLPGYRRAALALAKDMGFEAVEEVAVELAHAIYEDASGLDEDALDPAKLWRRLTVAGALGGVAGGAFNLPGAMVQALQKQDKVGDVAAALAYADQADRLAEAAGLSKTLGRAPDEAGKVLNQAAATSAWVDPEAWTTYWQSKGQDPRQKAVDALGNAKTYDEAMRAGTPLELRLGDFAAKLDDEARTHFAGELRASPDAMNRREAMERLAELEQEVDDPGATAELTSTEAARKVEDDLAQQLLATGYTEATARSTARQNALVFRTLAARWNQNRAGDAPARNAWSLYQEFAGEQGIRVNRDLPEILRQPVRFDIDRELARLAAGRKRAAADAADAAQGERDAAVTAQREADDRAMLERAAGQDGDALIALAIERLQAAPGTLTPSGAIAWLGAEFGQRPDAGWRLTDEQRATGDLLAAALRVRGANLRLLIEDAGKAKPDPVATTATAAPAPTQDATREAELDRLVGVAGNLHALYMEAADTRNASALSDARYATLVEQMGILAAEVAPRLAELPVDPARRDEFAAAVEFAQKEGRTLQQPAFHGTGNPDPYDRFRTTKIGTGTGRRIHGWGLYFTNRKEVARHYRDNFKEPGTVGRVYTVEIPEDADFLQWNARLTEQPTAVRTLVDKHITGAPSQMTGADLYRDFGDMAKTDPRFASMPNDEAASRWLAENGVPGSMFDGIDGSKNYVVFDDSRVEIKSYEQESRGSITFKPGDIAIRLGQSADLSTFLHESGHLYLELMGWMAAKPDAPADITKDAAAILAWLGVERFDQIEVKHHEQFARGYEAYLMEGKAPSAETRGLFARFQVWLTAVYKSVRALGVDLTPEIRGVFDRLLATEAEIAAAQEELAQTPLAQHADALGLDPAQRDELLRLTEAARIEAQERLTEEARREIERERSAAWRDLTEAMRLEVELEVNRQPAYIAQSVLRRGTLPGGVPLPPEQTPAPKLNAQALRDQIAAMSKIDDERKAIRKRFNGMVSAEGGITPDDAAALFGFANGAELVQTLADLRDRAELIKAETETRMLAKHGDIRLDGISAEVALEATHGAKRGELHLAELRLLTQRSAPDAKGRRRVAPIEVMRAAARAKVASLPAGQVSPEVYRRAERMARRQLEEALARADFDAARAHKQAELLHHEMVRAAVEAKVTVEKAVEKLRGFTERKRREKIGKAGGWEWTVTATDGATFTAPTEDEARRISERLPGSTWERTSGYLEQIDDLLERYDLAPRSGRADRKRQSLRAWVEQMVEQGRMVEIDPALVEGLERESWREMSVEQVEALRDAVLHIAHLARVKNRLSKLQQERDENEVAGEMRQTLAESHPKATPPDAATPTPGVWDKVVQFIAAHRKVANLMQVFDGLERGGIWWQTFVRPMNEASDREQVLMRDHGDRLNALWSTWRTATANDGWKANIKRQFDGFTGGLTRIQALMVALNWGNEGNRTRLMTGHKVDQAQVEAVLESLEEADWSLVQAVWDQINEFKSEVFALEQRVTGIPPPMVEAEPVATRFGTYRGGYFPAVADIKQSTKALNPDDADLGASIMAQAHGSTMTKRGHAKARKENSDRPLLLNPDVIGRHIRQVVHDLTHREALNDAARLLARQDIRQALLERTGPDTARQIHAWLVDIAQASRPMDVLSVYQSYLRRGTSLSTMAYNVTTAAIQVTGVMQSAAYVGPGRMLGAIRRIWGSTPEGAETWAQFINDKSAFMRERARTMTRELREAWEQSSTSTAGRALLEVQRASYFMTTWMQTQVDRPTWLAAYDRALAQGQDDASSVAIADQAVIDAQGSGAQKDLSAIQRSPIGGLFTAYMTFFAARYNLTADALSIPARRDPAFVMKAGLTLLTLYPGIMLTDALIRSGLRPEAPDDEDKDGKHWAAQFALDVAADASSNIVGLRELSGMLQGFTYKGPANLKLFVEAGNLITQIGQGEIDEGLAKAATNFAGAAFGLPSTQAIRTVQGLIHWIDDPSLDIRAPLFGPPREAR